MSDSHHPHHHHSSSPSEVNHRQPFSSSSSSSVNHHRSPPPPHHHHQQQQQHHYANGKNNHHDDMMMMHNNNNNNNTHNYYSRNDRYGHQQHEQQYRYNDERRSSHRSNYNRERDDDEDRNHRQHHRSHHSPYNHHHHSHNNHYNNNNSREYYRRGDNHQYDSLNHRRRYSQHEQHYRQYNNYDDRHHNNNNNNNNNNHSSPSSLFYDTMTNLHSDTCLIRMTNDESLLSHVIQYMKHHQLNHTLMNPSIEYKRSELMRGLREKHSEWIPQRLKINVPKESFNRWVIERKTIEELYCYQQQQQQQSNEEKKNENKNESVTIAATIVDPLIPSIVGYHHSSSSSPSSSSSSSNTTSVLLSREIFEDVPIKVNMFPKNAIEAKKSFEMYMQSARVMSRDTSISPLPSTVCDHIDELCNQEQEWINQIMKSNDHHIDEENNNKHKIMNDRLKLFKSIINPIFCQYWKPLVDDLCTDLALYAHDQAKQLHDLIEKQDVSIVGDNNNNTTSSSSSSVTVEENRRNHTINIYFREFQASLNLSHYHKLLRFYKIRKNDMNEQIQQQKEQEQLHATVDMNQFHEYLTCLLIRYAAFFGGLRNRYEGSGLQSALPEKAFAYLRDEFSVQLECFASPLNSYFPNYCSMFPDIDQIFGSVGSFFDFHPTQGSFESNPPFVEELMIKMVEHIEKLLSASDKELSFIVIVPNWMDAQSLQLMCKSKFLRKDCVLEANKHGYVNGFQHNSHDNKRKFRAVHETHVFFLQNDAGYKRWTPTEEKVDGFVRAFEVLN